MSVLSTTCALLLLLNGLYLSLKSEFFQIRRLGKIFGVTVGNLYKSRDADGFRAMSLALGSTIGIGNIIGVASAIIIGGPGAVFWILVTGFLGMIIKFSEIYLCVDEARKSGRKSGGPMYVFGRIDGGKYKIIGMLFSGSCVLASFFSGNLLQSKSIYEFSKIGFGADIYVVSAVIMPALFIILNGKDKFYGSFSALFVPLMAIFYIAATIFMIAGNIQYVPSALLSVLCSAFGFRQISGGFCGALLSAGIRVGIMRGLFTNEAGLGSAPIAHCSAKKTDPFTQGCWGIVEVFIDTVVVCMLTALAVLTSPVYLKGEFDGAFSLISGMFLYTFGDFGVTALSISAVCFAFASVVGWSFYGVKALEFFTESRIARFIYLLVFLGFVPLSAFVGEGLIWVFTDVFNSFMLIPNSLLLLATGGETVSALKRKESVKRGLQTLSAKLRS